ncbi:MAG TPA: L-histidine N(alpha)-methyltransferase [Bryobacteraceae bacterium]|nr:L-histidine N(alpha)-methyltransferase [Bryobacteraceae bacterium]
MFAPATVPRPSWSESVDPRFAQDVADGLMRPRKTLPASWLYDEVGSALFEVITVLPEYGLTRADDALLRRYAKDIIAAAGEPELIVELGSGTGTKTRHVLEAAAQWKRVDYLPIDISSSALGNCESALRSLERVSVNPIEDSYLPGLERAFARRRSGARVLALFLGSTIGNFTRSGATDLLRCIRGLAASGDCLLLGTDLVKPRHRLIEAYDDPLGVTASFNLNLLARINRELGGEFELSTFAHVARYNEREARVEMHLRSRIAQEVEIEALDLTVAFRRGETIWTESSHKFRPDDVGRMAGQAGWTTRHRWIDGDWGFAETLFACP